MIAARGLARRFKTKAGLVDAVRGIDLTVGAGEIVGLLGPNGAGKTTTLRMLATLLTPSAGTAIVAGNDLRKSRAVRRNIGYVAQVGGLPSPGTVLGEELLTQARLHGMSRPDAEASVLDIAGRLDLAGLRKRALVELSGGQRRRFDIALGLLHSPRLLFLDEPTTGLDPQSRANLWQHIRELRDDHGVTVLLTTHYLEEADALSDRVMVMDDGRIIADDKPDALKARVSGDVITIGVPQPDVAARSEAAVREAAAVRHFTVTDTALIVTVEDGTTALPPLLRVLESAGVRPASIAVTRPTLDDVFLSLTGRSLREGDQ
ncbi:ABC transporter ATP-binding protein [Amycolatopsis sp. MtRt-6]|uniref:ABC transporter ATP-binding protein n=1 Tax=Amycolatopsis sp. MtRt-6 TaxID=2792782 RepID=UPI001A90095D|nr:ABC transporter ATP-binding protein [Amycolatopsis sp. MtRt-6]